MRALERLHTHIEKSIILINLAISQLKTKNCAFVKKRKIEDICKWSTSFDKRYFSPSIGTCFYCKNKKKENYRYIISEADAS